MNPSEVEDCIRQHPAVKDVKVYPKSNRILGNIICCDIVTNDDLMVDESVLRHFLQSHIQEYKIPRIIHFVKSLDVTKTGKLSRI